MIKKVTKNCFIKDEQGAISLVFEREVSPMYPAFDFRINLCTWDSFSQDKFKIIDKLPKLSTEDRIGLVETIKKSYEGDINVNELYILKDKSYSIQVLKNYYSIFKMTINYNGVNYTGLINYDLLIGDKSDREGMLVRPNGNEVVLHEWDFQED